MSTKPTEIERGVRAALESDPRIGHPELIAVSVDVIGTVVLRGAVSAPHQRHAAVVDAKAVDGVLDVIADDLDVHLPIERRRHDDEIRAAAFERLNEDNRIHAERIHVSVSDGALTLTGYVREHAQRRHAEEDVATVSGVVAVTNGIEVR
jgi:osmotically-inducible protein OsmY